MGMIFTFFEFILSPLADIFNYLNIVNFRFTKKISKLLILLIFLVTIFIEILTSVLPLSYLDPIFTIIEIGFLILVGAQEQKNFKLLLNAGLLIEFIDLNNNILENICEQIFEIGELNSRLIYISLSLLECVCIYYFSKKINIIISGPHKRIIFYAAIYLNISSIVAYIIVSIEQTLSSGLVILLGILFIQEVYTVINVKVSIKTSKDLLANEEQKFLKKQNEQLKSNYGQLKEYAKSLEKDEDRLRRFKHDYRNILNSLKISAKKEDAKLLVKKLDEYTKEQFSDETLNRFRDVNHIYDDLLKSIIVAKLSKVYNTGIPYRFSCEKIITSLPFKSDKEHIDVVRIIGILFDNAIEASEQNSNSRIEAMVYQDKGNFEFVIRNLVDKKIKKSQIFKRGYTTKNNHSGLGLNNVLKIVESYPDSMIVDVNTEKDWFTFSLVVL